MKHGSLDSPQTHVFVAMKSGGANHARLQEVMGMGVGALQPRYGEAFVTQCPHGGDE